jgi:hypothetical protein
MTYFRRVLELDVILMQWKDCAQIENAGVDSTKRPCIVLSFLIQSPSIYFFESVHKKKDTVFHTLYCAVGGFILKHTQCVPN